MIGTQALILHPSFSPWAPAIDRAQSCYLLTGGCWDLVHCCLPEKQQDLCLVSTSIPQSPLPRGGFPRDRLPDTVSPVNYWEEYDQSKDQDIIAIY